MTEGFLGRWSQRKQALRAGQTLDEPVNQAPAAVMDVPTANDTLVSIRPELVEGHESFDQLRANGVASTGTLKRPAESPPPPSLADVQRLTAESDFKPFVARDVAPEVRNAAMKKLFSDPHYNVMDRMDTYIDDYSQADPLPESMLRQMASAKFLQLFGDQEESVAQSAQPPQASVKDTPKNTPQEPGTDHDHTDLRLQPNHAAGRAEPGRSTE